MNRRTFLQALGTIPAFLGFKRALPLLAPVAERIALPVETLSLVPCAAVPITELSADCKTPGEWCEIVYCQGSVGVDARIDIRKVIL